MDDDDYNPHSGTAYELGLGDGKMHKTEQVEMFMVKHGFPQDMPLPQAHPRLLAIATHLIELSKTLGHEDGDESRASLLIEELGEHLLGVSKGDPVEAADGLADLLYVAHGSSLRYDLCVDEVFEEVHRSNMSKAVTGPRVKDKGPQYSPPDVRGVLMRHRLERPL